MARWRVLLASGAWTYVDAPDVVSAALQLASDPHKSEVVEVRRMPKDATSEETKE